METLPEKQARLLIQEGKKAHKAIGQLIHVNNLHLTEEFITLFKEKFSFLFRNSMQNYVKKEEFLLQTSRIVNYLETILLPNFKETLDLKSLSPKIQYLFFRSINEAYIEFRKRHNFPM